ncbi:hypothetical protein AKJ16_DCAP17363 [Drosera capensis]
MKRIPRIKFPPRHPKPPSSTSSGSESQSSASAAARQLSTEKSDVPRPPSNSAVGGQASLQPKRTPVTDREIEAILLGGDY